MSEKKRTNWNEKIKNLGIPETLPEGFYSLQEFLKFPRVRTNKRSYGSLSHTWVEVRLPNGQTVGLGDPWPVGPSYPKRTIGEESFAAAVAYRNVMRENPAYLKRD